jgi:hypothetical protein
LGEGEFTKLVRNGDIEEKNRKNPKFPALNALIISLLPYSKRTFLKKSDMELMPEWFNSEFCREVLSKVVPEQLAFRKTGLGEIIYAKRFLIENGVKKFCFITHFGPGTKIEDFYELPKAKKYVSNIFDPKIRKDFNEKLDRNLTKKQWKSFILKYQKENHLKRIAKKASQIWSEGTPVEFGEIGKIQGQYYKKDQQHKGQIVYQEKTGKWKVMPVYVFESVFQKFSQYKEKYEKTFFFRSHQPVHINGKCAEVPNGIYKLVTIRTDGRVTVSSLDGGITISSTVNKLFSVGCMRPFEHEISYP